MQCAHAGLQAAGLKANKSITYLNIRGYTVTDAIKGVLMGALRANKSVTKLRIDKNGNYKSLMRFVYLNEAMGNAASMDEHGYGDALFESLILQKYGWIPAILAKHRVVASRRKADGDFEGLLPHSIALGSGSVHEPTLLRLYRAHFEMDSQLSALLLRKPKLASFQRVMMRLAGDKFADHAGNTVLHRLLLGCESGVLAVSQVFSVTSQIFDADDATARVPNSAGITPAEIATLCHPKIRGTFVGELLTVTAKRMRLKLHPSTAPAGARAAGQGKGSPRAPPDSTGPAGPDADHTAAQIEAFKMQKIQIAELQEENVRLRRVNVRLRSEGLSDDPPSNAEYTDESPIEPAAVAPAGRKVSRKLFNQSGGGGGGGGADDDGDVDSDVDSVEEVVEVEEFVHGTKTYMLARAKMKVYDPVQDNAFVGKYLGGGQIDFEVSDSSSDDDEAPIADELEIGDTAVALGTTADGRTPKRDPSARTDGGDGPTSGAMPSAETDAENEEDEVEVEEEEDVEEEEEDEFEEVVAEEFFHEGSRYLLDRASGKVYNAAGENGFVGKLLGDGNIDFDAVDSDSDSDDADSDSS